MRLQFRFLTLLTMLSLAVSFGCGGDGGGSAAPEKIALEELSATWSIVSADLDGETRTDEFTGFELTISGDFDSESPEGPYNYDVFGEQPVLSPWPQDGDGGTWTFGDTPSEFPYLLMRNDGANMECTISESGQLTVEFNFSGAGYEAAKVAEVQGDWTFVFDPN